MVLEEKDHVINMFRKIILLTSNFYKYEKTENNIFSPLSLHILLPMIFQDPAYQNERIILKGLYYPGDDINLTEYFKSYGYFLTFLSRIPSETFSFSNKLFLRDNYRLESYFKTVLSHFNFGIETLDFSKPETSIVPINSWIESRTNGNIKDLLPSKSSTADSRLSLLNTIHFNGVWHKPFTSETNPREFFLNENDSIQVNMMRTTGEFNHKYDENKKIHILELPFTTDDVSLLLILPDQANKLEAVVNDCMCLEHLSNDMHKEEMEVTIPKFITEHIQDCVNKSNLEECLEYYLLGLLDNDEFLKFEEMRKKEFVNVNERDVEIATGLAFTALHNEIDEQTISTDELQMLEMDINTSVSNRFAKTLITCKFQNNQKSAKEAVFAVLLPEKAFITEFVMEMDGKRHKSYIKEKTEAKAIYEEAVALGKSSGIVEGDKRNTSKFTVSVNLEPQSVAIFLLTYEEMLERFHDQYELILNVCPGQIIDNLKVEVIINESKPLKFVKTPPIRSGTEINQRINKFLNSPCDVKMISSNTAIIHFNPDVKLQRKFGYCFGIPPSEGFSGQFVVQYDVERDPTNGEILLRDGYFVHFFAPNDLDPIPKHVVFVLDTSTSMHGRKIDQLKDAMMSILGEIRKDDLISIVEFNTEVIVWNINSEQRKIVPFNEESNCEDLFGILSELSIPNPVFSSNENIEKAKRVTQRMMPQSNTFISGALEVALYLSKVGQEIVKSSNSKYQPIIIFLTDGEPTAGIICPNEIIELVTQRNLKYKVPIFSLSFGNNADKELLRELSLKNFGFSRHIYEASDASLQLQSFYKQISSPLLSDINFKYQSDVVEVTRTHFPIYFSGCELVVSGRCRDKCLATVINGYGSNGTVNLKSNVETPISSIERLWAYLTVKQLLEARSCEENKEELTKKAIDLAIKYSFVTEVTSLVVVKPDKTNDIGLLTDEKLDIPEFADGDEACFRSMLKKRKYMGYKKYMESEEHVEPEKPKKLEFLANRPFIFMLLLKNENHRTIISLGHVYKPKC